MRSTALWRRAWPAFAAAGVAATVVYALPLPAGVDAACFLVTGLGAVAAFVAGPRRYGAGPRAAWHALAAAGLFFLAGALLRPLVTGEPLLADLATVPGYACLGVFFVLLVRSRGTVARHAALDGLIVCLAGGLTSALLLAAPAAAVPGRPAAEAVLAALYPLLDVALLALVINLTFTARTWPVSLVLLAAGIGMLLAGDVAYSVIGVTGRTYASPLLDVPFLLAFTLIGAATLHPSVAALGRGDRPPVQAWSWQRMLLLVPASLAPFALLPVAGDSARARLLIGACGTATVVLLLVRAVSAVRAQAEAQRNSEYQARHDPLTGLPNRRAVTAEVERLVATVPAAGPGRVWVALLDLDGFKWVNDSWGHDTGDQLVIEVAARLRAALPAGVPPARVGGDDFLIAFVGDDATARHLVETVRSCFARPLPVRDTEVVITASIGLAHAPGGGDPAATAEALLRDADTAMYQAKVAGRGRYAVFER